MPIQRYHEYRTTTNTPAELPEVVESAPRTEPQARGNHTGIPGFNLAIPSHFRSLSTGNSTNAAPPFRNRAAELEGDGPSRPRSISPHSFTFGNHSTHSFSFGQSIQELDTRLESVSRLRLPRMSDLSINESRVIRIPYDLQSEAEPDATFFNPDFQRLAELGRNIAEKVVTSLGRCQEAEVHQPDLDRLLGDANKIKSFKSSRTRTIAILGDSGEGKSSLVNSLLHCSGIAKASDAGRACTSVVTEYHQKKEDHAAPITIEAEYLSDAEIEEFIEELIWSYRQFFMKEWREGDKDFHKQEAESEVAWSALSAAFGDSEHLKELFGNDSSDGLKVIKDKLLEWCGDLAWPDPSRNGLWTSTAETADECCDKTAVFMDEKLWPFTKVIRIYLDARVLQAGIVLADLPGLQDVNLAKVRATERYLFKCDHVFVVARISRAISNQSLKNSLLRTLKNHIPNEWEQLAGRYMNISIICTHSEDINVVSSRRDLCGYKKPLSESVMLRLDQQIMQASNDRDRRLRRILLRRHETPVYLLKAYVHARNDLVKAGLQKSYANMVPGGDLPVHCVSNEDYEGGCKKNDLELIDASGIPALRRFCKATTAEAQLLDTRHTLESSLPALLNSITLFVSTFDVQHNGRSEEVRASILAGIEALKRTTTDSTHKLRSGLQEELQEGIYDMTNHRIREWEEKAHKAASIWMGWHHMSFDAFVRNNGTHSTFAAGSHRWNRDLIWSSRAELAQYWDWLEQDGPSLFDDSLKALSDAFRSLTNRIQRSELPAELTTMLVAGIKLRDADARFIVGRYRAAFLQDLSTVRRQASEDTPSSYVLQQMTPFYRAATQERGQGKMRRQHSHVCDGIDELFPGMAVLLHTALDSLLGSSTRNMDAELQAIVATLRRDFEMVYSPTSVVGGRERAREEELKEEVDSLVAENVGLQRDLGDFWRSKERSAENVEEMNAERVEDANVEGLAAAVESVTFDAADAEQVNSVGDVWEDDSSESE